MSKSFFYVLIIISMIFWGISWINGKILMQYLNAYEVIFARMLISCFTMLPIFFIYKKEHTLDIKTVFLFTLAALVLLFYSVLFLKGVECGNAGFGGALVTTLIPINTFIFVAFLSRKSFSLRQLFALILGGFGVFTILNMWSFSTEIFFSKDNIYFLCASIVWPILTIVSSYSKKLNPLFFTYYMYLITTVIVYIVFINNDFFLKIIYMDYIFWINMLSLSVLNTTFATSIYFIGIAKLGANNASSFIFLVPSSALISGAIFLDEKITYTTVLGTICTVISIYILNNINILKMFKIFKTR